MRVSLKTTTGVLALVALLALVLGSSTLAMAKDKKIEILVGEGAWLGVQMKDLDEKLAQAMDLDGTDGVLVDEVVANSPAEKAGLEDGDVILAFDGDDLDGSKDLARHVAKAEPGDEVELKVLRDGKARTFKVTLGEREAKGRRAMTWTMAEGDDDDDDNVFFFQGGDDDNVHVYTDRMAFFGGDHGFLGVSLGSLSEQLGDYFGVADGEGALVNEVTADGPAEKAGLKAGDFIVAVADEQVEGPGDVTATLVDTEPGDEVEVTVVRDRKQRTFKVALGERPETDFDLSDAHIGMMMPKLHGLEGLKALPHDLRIRRLHRGDEPLVEIRERENLGDLRQQMEDLKQELKELKKELNK